MMIFENSEILGKMKVYERGGQSAPPPKKHVFFCVGFHLEVNNKTPVVV